MVFNDGRVEQAGPAREVYERPATAFVAGFVGTSNVLGSARSRRRPRAGAWSVRPEKIAVGPADATGRAGPDHLARPGVVAELVYTGPTTRCVVELDAGGRLTALLLNGGRPSAPARERGAARPAVLARRSTRSGLHDPSPG